MAKLTDEHRTFIVTRLALFDSPTQIATALKAEYDVDLPREQVRHYDPTRPGSDVAKKWAALFDATRADFLAEKVKVPVAHRAVRLAMLWDMAQAAFKQKNYRLVRELLEQAAKESGDAYTNVRKLEAADPADALAKLWGVTRDEVLAMVSAVAEGA